LKGVPGKSGSLDPKKTNTESLDSETIGSLLAVYILTNIGIYDRLIHPTDNKSTLIFI